MPARIFHTDPTPSGHPVLGPSADKGFTLLELIASLVLLGLLSAIFGMGLVAAMKSHEFNRTNVHLSQKAQSALMRISRELMELTAIDAVDGGTGDPFIIYRRIDPSNAQAAVRYALHFDSGTSRLLLYTALDPDISSLDGTTAGSGDTLINGVKSFSLQYFQGSNPWSWGSDFALLSSIRANLQLIRPETPTVSEDFSSMVHLRNTNNYGGAAPTSRPASKEDYSCFIRTIGMHRNLPIGRNAYVP